MPKPRVDPRWIRGKVDLAAIDEGCRFDQDAADFVCEWIETLCCQSHGPDKGKPLILLPWQRDFLQRLFGWKRPDGTRRYRRAYLEVGKKNGKSTLFAAVGLYLLLGDGEGSPEVYLNACDMKQAAIIFREQKRMVQASPDLKCRLKVLESVNNMRVVDEAGDGVIVVNSAIADSKDGLNPHGILFDELHRQPNRHLWDVFRYASSARTQPLTLSITTAGEDEGGIWYEQREHSEKVNAGDVLDTAHLGVVYRALETDQLDDPATWRRANPSLGHTISEENFRRDLEEAQRNPADFALFRRLRLNIITRGTGKFLPAGRWEACEPKDAKPPEWDTLRGVPCFIGLDLSCNDDLTAAIALFGDPEDDDGYDVLCRFYLPEDNIEALARKHGVPYQAWADHGYLVLTDGEVIDFDAVRKDIVELAGEFDVRKVMMDPYLANRLGTQLMEHDGLPVAYVRQGFGSLAAPTIELERLVLAGKLRHGNHPVLRWMASNAVAKRDDAGNPKLSKFKSRLKIDGMAALVNAIAAAIADGGDDGGGSVYDTRGLILL